MTCPGELQGDNGRVIFATTYGSELVLLLHHSSSSGSRRCPTVLAKGYLTKLLANEPVARYLKQKQPELLTEFEAIVQAASLDH